uniref:NADH-ubiquinone oxidoreductase chain 2 n=1 Tax=Bambusiphaga taibaishana TaxID=2008833 RepID=A0A7S5DCL3_9HEMI|nr:NADH dehydrogenase subunit 2 [Bambusiphaga taibaishana]QBZ37965.1 NADH dehydrogenase subunit 2 [Bambusiphaga taibaishana]
MKLNSSNMMCMISLTLSTTLSTMTNNWLSMWMLMELNMFMFIPLMAKNKVNDQSIKYFIIQSFSSYMLMFSILMMSICMNMPKSNMLMMTSLLIKIGMSPFHIWVPEIMYKIKWNECFLLTSILKITPMILMNKLLKFEMIMIPMILSLILGSISGFNQFSMKKLMAFSSIFNISWMTSSFYLSKKITMFFLIVYSILNFKIMNLFKKLNILYTNQINHLELMNKMKINSSMLSIMGLPPMMGFLPKLIILKEISNKSNMLMGTMILTSLMSMFMYLQMNSFTLSNLSMKKKCFKLNKFKSFYMMNLITISLTWLTWTN